MPLARRYERVRELGRGSFGTVWLVRRRCDRRLFAMKTLELPPLCSRDEKDLAERRQALREVEILQSLESPYLVRYHETLLVPATEQQERSELHIFTEYCDAGDLASHLRKAGRPGGGLPEAEVWRFAAAMLQGLCELHRQNVMHRDLKPANIFLSRAPPRRGAAAGVGGGLRGRLPTAAGKGGGGQRGASGLQAKLGDLGLARSVSGSAGMASTVVGTPHYIAPEIYEGQPYDEKADVYSFGACVYELMHGKPPWAHCEHVAAIVRHVLRLDGDAAEHEVFMDPSFSADLRALVTACMARSPSERPSARELLARVPPELGGGAEVVSAAEGAAAVAAAPGPVVAKALPPGPPPLSAGLAFRPPPRQEAPEVTMSPAELGAAAEEAMAPRGPAPPAAQTEAAGTQEVTLRPATLGGCGEKDACAEPPAADRADQTKQLPESAQSGDLPAAEEARNTRLLRATRATASPEPCNDRAGTPCDSALLETRPRLEDVRGNLTEQKGGLKAYVTRAQCCISRWRRDRRGPPPCPSEDGEACRSGCGDGAGLDTRSHCALRSPASAKGRRVGSARGAAPAACPGARVASEARLLEVVGVAMSLSPKVARPLRL